MTAKGKRIEKGDISITKELKCKYCGHHKLFIKSKGKICTKCHKKN